MGTRKDLVGLDRVNELQAERGRSNGQWVKETADRRNDASRTEETRGRGGRGQKDRPRRKATHPHQRYGDRSETDTDNKTRCS